VVHPILMEWFHSKLITYLIGHQRKRSEENLNAMAMLEMHISHVTDILEILVDLALLDSTIRETLLMQSKAWTATKWMDVNSE